MSLIGRRINLMLRRMDYERGITFAKVNGEAVAAALAALSAAKGRTYSLKEVVGTTWKRKDKPRYSALQAVHLAAIYTLLREQGVVFDYTALLTPTPFRVQVEPVDTPVLPPQYIRRVAAWSQR